MDKINISVKSYSQDIHRIENELKTLDQGGISIDESFLEILEAEKINYNESEGYQISII